MNSGTGSTPRCICPDRDTFLANCPVHGDTARIKDAVLDLRATTTAANDQVLAMTDAELAERLTSGRWSTLEVHEAGRRLARRGE